MKSPEIFDPSSPDKTIAFGPFTLDPYRRRLMRTPTGDTVAITGRPFEALHYLVSRPGILVPKAELFRVVWNGISVEENSLARCISTIRKALGDTPKGRRYIVTEPGRGYRFVAQVNTPSIAKEAHPDRLSANLDANQLYVSACSLLSRPGGHTILLALEKLEAACRLDPAFALAHASIANANVLLGVFGLAAPLKVFPRAREAALTAVELCDGLAEGHLQLGHIAAMFELDRSRADLHLRRALMRDERSAMAHHHIALLAMSAGQFDEALIWMHRALDLQPLAANIRANIGMILYYAGRYQEAADLLEATIEIHDFAHARSLLGRCWLRLGQPDKALDHFRLRKETSIGSAADEPAALALAGRHEESEAMLDALLASRQTGYVSAYDLATVYAAQRKPALSLDWLDIAMEERAQPICALGVDPAFRELYSEPRFAGLVQRLQS
ncbi:winged helix-turn-helix domain-containing protein [Asticcacaulis sp. 201]|uniref:winged helix-turn-helix domain-containing protein n=1 Tax=Asticcacaulis sp. 201 TaxID=3028787 RepID=UPI0029168CFD|nr:winged helix-turn-helix domain-containing protein [Asticcacaulis sp. 201]MDV6329935.1 winged helix-turn-helix domain-containing protein [Asticcacaulis sp. 201]